MTEFKAAPAVARIAEDLIGRHHPDLVGERIEYVFREKATKSKGREVWGTARLIGGLNAFLATDEDEQPYDGTVESFFVIEIAEDIWGEIDSTQRVALVDHELCHCVIDFIEDDEGVETRKRKIKAHDVEEFRDVVRRHGLWRTDVELFSSVIESVATAEEPVEA